MRDSPHLPPPEAVPRPDEPRLRPSSPAPRRIRLKILTPVAAAVGGVLICVLVAAALIRNAQTAVRQELDAAFQIVRAHAVMRMPPPFSSRDTLGEAVRLAEEIDAQRHVSAVFLNPQGVRLSRSPADEGSEAPRWFLRLLEPEIQTEIFAVTHYPNVLGALRLASDPRDEIDEVWEDFRVILPLLALTSLALSGGAALFNMFLLRRLDMAVQAVARMRGGDLRVRAPEGRLAELAALSEGVNALARRLQEGRAENTELQRRLLSLSEEERARIASDLHDEIGPQIFGLQAAARQAALLAKGAPSADPQLAEALEAVSRHAEALRRGVRTAISDLRPMAAGGVSLAELLQELAADFADLHPGLTIRLEVDPEASADELREIAVYRFVRESALNALRHGGAGRLWVEVGLSPERDAILARVSDDGRGPSSEPPIPHLGHLGMRDRALALGAQWSPPRREGGRILTELRTPRL